jgi:ATP-binding cassette subfamily C protein LapB
MVAHSQLTMGALVACSILSGRILAPVTQLGMHLTSWANVRASLQGLDALWRLEDDHHGAQQPVFLENIQGNFRVEGAQINLQGRTVLQIPAMRIRAGEKIAVVGPIGSGKTTFLRLLSGLYRPNEGRVWLDDVDLAHLSKGLLAEHLAYVPQEGRLLSGSLRDNLILGLMDPGDAAIFAAAKLTGLYDSAIATHPLGLQQEISEGGTGLSGGQRQLVNLTRMFLRGPRLWLLDEPTASLDRSTERSLIESFMRVFKSEDTVVIVTHKPELLQLVDRVIVVVDGQVTLDGPRDDVLRKLQFTNTQQQPERKVAV